MRPRRIYRERKAERDTFNANDFIFRKQGGAETLVRECTARKVKIHQIGPASIRCVTHKDVDREDIDRALQAFTEITRTW